MKRFIGVLQLIALIALTVALVPKKSYAQTSCTDQYLVCINSATAYSGMLFQLAEAECGLAYTGCLASKLKFW
jgi:hypothetical protein